MLNNEQYTSSYLYICRDYFICIIYDKKNVHAVKVNIRIRIFLPCYLTTTYIKTRKLMKEIGYSNTFYNYAMAPAYESIILCKFNSLSLSLSRSLFLSLCVCKHIVCHLFTSHCLSLHLPHIQHGY